MHAIQHYRIRCTVQPPRFGIRPITAKSDVTLYINFVLVSSVLHFADLAWDMAGDRRR